MIIYDLPIWATSNECPLLPFCCSSAVSEVEELFLLAQQGIPVSLPRILFDLLWAFIRIYKKKRYSFYPFGEKKRGGRWYCNGQSMCLGFPWCVWLRRPDGLAYQPILLPPKGQGGNLPCWDCWLASNHWRTLLPFVESNPPISSNPFFPPPTLLYKRSLVGRVLFYAFIKAPGRQCFHTAEWQHGFAL